MDTVEHEQRRLRLVDVPTKPLRKAPLVFFLLVIATLVVASVVAVTTDVRTDGYNYYAQRQTIRFS